MKSLVLLAALVIAAPLAARDNAAGPVPSPADGPQLMVDFPESETIPGQPLSLRLTVLVPTYMPSPPVWPSLETRNVLVRLPERSTTPTSRRIGGPDLVRGHAPVPDRTHGGGRILHSAQGHRDHLGEPGDQCAQPHGTEHRPRPFLPASCRRAPGRSTRSLPRSPSS